MARAPSDRGLPLSPRPSLCPRAPRAHQQTRAPPAKKTSKHLSLTTCPTYVLAGMHHLHTSKPGRPVVHRDLKSSNVQVRQCDDLPMWGGVHAHLAFNLM